MTAAANGLTQRRPRAATPPPPAAPAPGSPVSIPAPNLAEKQVITNGKAVKKAEDVAESEAILQIYLLSGARGIFQTTRICAGPLLVSMSQEYGYSTEDKGRILSAFAAGYAFTQVVGGMAADRFGGAPVIQFGLMTSALSLCLLPVAADAGLTEVWWLLWLMGLTQGPTYPAQLVTTAQWVSGSLRSYASALGAAGSTAGALFALGLTPPVASRLGWRAAAYLMGAATLVFAVIWQFYGRSKPAQAQVKTTSASAEQSVPWQLRVWKLLRIFTALPVLAVYFAHSTHNFVRYFLTGWMPTYYHEILHASADNTAVQLVIPDVVGLLMSFVSAHIGRSLQQKGTLSALGVRRVFATISFLGAALGLVATAQATTIQGVTACQCFVHGLATLQGLGFGASYLDVSKHHNGLITGVGNTIATAASFASPVFASYVLTLGGQGGMSPEDWQRLFLAFAASNILGVIIYTVFVSVDPVDDDERSDATLSVNSKDAPKIPDSSTMSAQSNGSKKQQ